MLLRFVNGGSLVDFASAALLVAEAGAVEAVGILGRGKPVGGLPLTLPIRRRGTRVWIFCSKFLTLARISDTICTPLFLDAVLATEDMVAVEGWRLVGVLGTGDRGEPYIVADRGIPVKVAEGE